jgi:hypothetical protein
MMGVVEPRLYDMQGGRRFFPVVDIKLAFMHSSFDVNLGFMYNRLFPKTLAAFFAGSMGILLTINEVSNHVRGHKNRWQAV